MKVGIVDYEGGNLASVQCAVNHLGYSAEITSDPEVLLNSDKVIFPGVGAAKATMSALSRAGLVKVLKEDLPAKGIPCLGICIGIQVLFEFSEEENTETLGIFKGRVKRFPEDDSLKVPHIGWNQVHFTEMDSPFLKGVKQDDHFYFVNSFYVEPEDSEMVLGYTQYGPVKFCSLIRQGTWTASQFHLEKSGRAGLKLLENFLNEA
ncbi:MAG: imidazole glycerol phosphate synthase subunit HisH [Planctomycetes bacterium]|nr:imidazole glycerol phosphate synthase subunit HisH [Planctomycetota bacterium]